MRNAIQQGQPPASNVPAPVRLQVQAAFGEPRNFFSNRFVYLVVSQRARGLSVGINLNPDQACNFKCVYCEVARARPAGDKRVNVRVMNEELKWMLAWLHQGKFLEHDFYRALPPDLLELREIALSGNGEPTLCPNFAEVVQGVVHLRAMAAHAFFKVVLITNGTGLHLPVVQHGLRWFTAQDEIWIKLDAGTQAAMDRVNRADYPLDRVLANVLLVGRQRPIVIQSLFPLLEGQEPTTEEIDEYVQRLAELRESGAQISLVQVYSAHRPTALAECRHLRLESLSKIAHRVKEVAGLPAEVF